MHVTCFRRDKTGEFQTCSLNVSHFSPINRTSCFLIWAFVLPRQLKSAWSNVPLVTSTWCLSVLGEEVFEKDVAPVKFFQNSQSSTGLHSWMMLQRFHRWQMYQMYRTLCDRYGGDDRWAHSERIPVSAHCHAEAGVDVSPHGATQTPDMRHCGKISYKVVHFPEKRSSYQNSSKLRTLIWPKAKDSLSISVRTQKNLPPSTWMKLFGVSYLGRKANGLKRPGLATLCSALPEEPLPSIFHHWRLRHLFCSTKGRTQDSIGIVAEGHTQVLQWKGNFRSRFFWNKKWANAAIIKWHEKGDSLKQPDITADVINSSPAQECIKKKSEE